MKGALMTQGLARIEPKPGLTLLVCVYEFLRTRSKTTFQLQCPRIRTWNIFSLDMKCRTERGTST